MSEFNLPDLPDLPDLDEMLSAAAGRIDYYTRERDRAQAEIDAAARFIARLGGGRPKRKQAGTKAHNVSAGAYEAALTALAEGKYAAIVTVQGRTGMSPSHVGSALNLAVERGHATRERAGRRFRYRITEEGLGFVTAPVVPVVAAQQSLRVAV